jgi:hypothetical protein
MMEWEQLNDAFSSISLANGESSITDKSVACQDESTTSKTMLSAKKSRSTKNKDSDVATVCLTKGLVNDNDVALLVSKKNRIIRRFVPGTTFYWSQIYQYRPKFQKYAKTDVSRNKIARDIAESVWGEDGRFLAFDEKSSSLSTIPNNRIIFDQIQKDLSFQPRPRKRRVRRGRKRNKARHAESQSSEIQQKKRPTKRTGRLSQGKRKELPASKKGKIMIE